MKLLQRDIIRATGYLFLVFASECLMAVGFYFCYSMFSMLAYGEGLNSFMYSRANEVIFYSIVSGVPFGYNLKNACKFYKAADTFRAIGLLIVNVVYLFLVLSAIGAQGR